MIWSVKLVVNHYRVESSVSMSVFRAAMAFIIYKIEFYEFFPRN